MSSVGQATEGLYDRVVTGTDVTAPTITIVSPTPSTPPGDPGGFSIDYGAARFTPIVVDITDPESAISVIFASAVLQGSVDEDVAYRVNVFVGEYVALSTQISITDGERLTIVPSDGWPSQIAAIGLITMTIIAINSVGQADALTASWELPAIGVGPTPPTPPTVADDTYKAKLMRRTYPVPFAAKYGDPLGAIISVIADSDNEIGGLFDEDDFLLTDVDPGAP